MDRDDTKRARRPLALSPGSHNRCWCRHHLPAPAVILVKDWPKKSGVAREKTTAGEESEYNPLLLSRAK